MFQRGDNKGDYFFSEASSKKRRQRKKKTLDASKQDAVNAILSAPRHYRPQRRNRDGDFGGDRGGFRGGESCGDISDLSVPPVVCVHIMYLCWASCGAFASSMIKNIIFATLETPSGVDDEPTKISETTV